MSVVQVLTLIGTPSIIAAFILYVVKRLHDSAKRIRALEAGVQALLRAEMIDSFNHYTDKGFAPLYARENFENLWTQYHALGANGVINDIHEKFMDLPTQRQGG